MSKFDITTFEITHEHRVRAEARWGIGFAPLDSYANDVAARLEAVLDESQASCDMAFNMGVEAAARCASRFSMKPERSLHPLIKWESMKEEVRMAAHSTAQLISLEIYELLRNKETEDGE